MKTHKPLNIKNPEEPLWFILYNGESADGMGTGQFAGRTKSVTVAFTFYKQFIDKNPYSVGYVNAVDDTGVHRMSFDHLASLDAEARAHELKQAAKSASKKYDIKVVPWNPEEQPAIPKPDGFGKWQ